MTQALNASTFNFSELSSLEDTLYDTFAEIYMDVTGEVSKDLIGGIYEGDFGEAATDFVKACFKALNENVNVQQFIEQAQANQQ